MISPTLSPAKIPNLTLDAAHVCTCCGRDYVIGTGVAYLGSVRVEGVPWFRFIPYCSVVCLITHYPAQGTG